MWKTDYDLGGRDMKIEEMIARKRELGYTNERIAELSGVPLGTVQKIMSGQTKAPRYDTIQALENVLGENFAMREEAFAYNASGFAGAGKPTGMSGKEQGGYTLEDYYGLPEDKRVELIDGVIYDMSSPSDVHQQIVGFLNFKFWGFIESGEGECTVYMAPTDVRLDMDDKTMVQPDLLVQCSSKGTDPRRIEGAPDLVVEVLSPSTRRKDLLLKTMKYGQAGVREYWIIDPRDKSVIVYDFEHEDTVNTYTFEDEVPVTIYDGELRIDFKELTAHLEKHQIEGWV